MVKNKIECIRDKVEKSLHKNLEQLSQLESKNFFLKTAKSLHTESLPLDKVNTAALYDEAYIPLAEISKYTVLAGGKRWRAILCVLSAQLETETLSPIEEQILYTLSSVIECIHAASLIHDDIEDASEKRRGALAAHIQYGLDNALNAGSWLYFFAMQLLESPAIPEPKRNLFLGLVRDAVYSLHLGQAMDIRWHQNLEFMPSLSEYKTMIRLKTGTLAALASTLGMLAVDEHSEHIELFSFLMQELGIVFQIQDDVQNICAGLPGKDAADDIVEGKKSLPVILHCKQFPNDTKKLISLFVKARQEGVHSISVNEALTLLRQSEAIPNAVKYAYQRISFVKQKLNSLYPESETKKLLLFFIDNLTAHICSKQF